MDIINPATGYTIKQLTEDSPNEVMQKIDLLKIGQKKWAKVPIEERISIIINYGKLVEKNVEELAKILTSETGKPLQQSINEIKGARTA